MKSLYLLVNFFTVIIPVLFSFHPKIKFYQRWKYFFPAAIFIGVFFIVWDSIFTSYGIWGFNPQYISGIYLFGLPLEEILFFICIPFSCVFTYFCLDKFYCLSWNPRKEKIFCLIFSTFLLVIGLFFWEQLYTSVTFISTALVCLVFKFVIKIKWFGKAVSVYAVLLMPFLIVNGILTGTGLEEPIVWYNDSENMDIRVLTIPVEDVIYGFELILLNIFCYKWFSEKFGSLSKQQDG
jgi:lycopene cyclase domain-containing protein